MANGVDATVDSVELPSSDPIGDRPPPQPALQKLIKARNPVLGVGNPGDGCVWCVDLCTHVGT